MSRNNATAFTERTFIYLDEELLLDDISDVN